MIAIQYKWKQVDEVSGNLIDPRFYQDSFFLEADAIFDLNTNVKQFPHYGKYEYVLEKTYKVVESDQAH